MLLVVLVDLSPTVHLRLHFLREILLLVLLLLEKSLSYRAFRFMARFL